MQCGSKRGRDRRRPEDDPAVTVVLWVWLAVLVVAPLARWMSGTG